MLNVGDNVLIKGKIVKIETDCDNQITYKVKMPIMDGWDEVWFPFQAINVVETKGEANE